jgi:thiol-disulfide isomerase/thioredoxin
MEVLMFKTPSCRSCHAMTPLVYSAKVKGQDITIIDATEHESRGRVLQYGIHSVPTFIKLENGVEIERHTGAMPMREFYDFIGV